MSARHAVVSGASIAGLSTAFWLSRTGWDVTVVERADAFRDGGQNVDVRGVAHEVLDLMGLTEAVRARNTTETGTVIVDEQGRKVAELPSDGEDGATAELEVLRGDLARSVLEVLPDDVQIRYGDVIDAVDDDPHGNVAVTLHGGDVLDADLLVVADGVGSTTRDLVFGPDEVEKVDLGVAMAFGTIERTPDDDDTWRWLVTTEGRQVHLRPDNEGTTRAILAFRNDDREVVSLDREILVARLRERYAGVEWQAGRVLDGFATTDDLYVDQLTQIRMPHWHRGRVCVVGDAAWCVTPMGGRGASFALTSGYVLAAALADDRAGLAGSLETFETWMRPVVAEVSNIPKAAVPFAYPTSRLALGVQRRAVKVASSWPFKEAVERVMGGSGAEHELPPMPTAAR